MSALLRSSSHPGPGPSGRRGQGRPRRLAKRRLAKYTPMLEVGARLAVNGVLAIAALGALVQLVPYTYSQSHRLEQVTQAVKSASASNTKLKAEFGHYFDPSQAGRLMQEYSGYKSPKERQIVWTDPTRP